MLKNMKEIEKLSSDLKKSGDTCLKKLNSPLSGGSLQIKIRSCSQQSISTTRAISAHGDSRLGVQILHPQIQRCSIPLP